MEPDIAVPKGIGCNARHQVARRMSKPSPRKASRNVGGPLQDSHGRNRDTKDKDQSKRAGRNPEMKVDGVGFQGRFEPCPG